MNASVRRVPAHWEELAATGALERGLRALIETCEVCEERMGRGVCRKLYVCDDCREAIVESYGAERKGRRK